jgi:hypothetical protein
LLGEASSAVVYTAHTAGFPALAHPDEN